MYLLSKSKLNVPGIKVPGMNLKDEAKISPRIDENILELKRDISNALIELKSAVLNFETAENTEMVEYYVYKMKACEIRYQYLLKQMRTLQNSQ